MGHETLTTPLYEWLVFQNLGFDTIYLRAKLDNFSFNRSRDIIGGSKL